VGNDALFRVLAGGITNDEFRKDWSSPGKDHICSALAAGWIPQFDIFLERGLKLGHAQVQSDRDLFEADDTEYDFLLDSAAAGGVEMLMYAFSHGLDRPNLSDQDLSDNIRRTIRRQGLPSLKLLLDKGVKFRHDEMLFEAIVEMLRDPVDREIAT
jgi:hypothetical protein